MRPSAALTKIFVDPSTAPNFYCPVGALPFPMALPLPVAEIGRWEASQGSSGLTKAIRSSADRATHGRSLSANFEASSQEPDLNGEKNPTNEQTPDAEDLPRSMDEMAQKRKGPHFHSLRECHLPGHYRSLTGFHCMDRFNVYHKVCAKRL